MREIIVSMIIYDAQSGGALIGPESGFPFVALSFASIAIFISAIAAAKQSPRARSDLAYRMMPAFVGVAIALAAVGWWTFGQIDSVVWAHKLATGNYERLDGCIYDFGETVSSDHDIGIDTFTLQERRFQISDVVWQFGYHTSHHRGSPIGPNTHLLVYADGPHMLRIEVLPTSCLTPASPAPRPTAAG